MLAAAGATRASGLAHSSRHALAKTLSGCLKLGCSSERARSKQTDERLASGFGSGTCGSSKLARFAALLPSKSVLSLHVMSLIAACPLRLTCALLKPLLRACSYSVRQKDIQTQYSTHISTISFVYVQVGKV